MVWAKSLRTLLTTTLPRKTPTGSNLQILDSVLSSIREHARQEGLTANTCAVCSTSFQTNSELESHARSSDHSAFLCTCDTGFSRYSSLSRHITSKTGSGFPCQLCDKNFPRVDKLYDHLRDGHKVSQKVLDRHRNRKELGQSKQTSPPIKPKPVPVIPPQASSSGGFGSPWSTAVQMNGMNGRHHVNMASLSPNSINPAQLMVSCHR